MLLIPGRGQAVLIDLINGNNTLPAPITAEDVIFSSPRVSPDLPNGTVVTLYGILGGLYAGQVVLKYQRFNLSTAFSEIRPALTGLGSESLYKMLEDINRALGISLTSEDVEEVAFDWETLGDTVAITVKALPTSLLYQGEFTLDYTRIRPSLEESLPVVEVDPFSLLEDSVEGKASVAMATWGIDFSAEKRNFTLTVIFGRWLLSSMVANLMRNEFGFANWPSVDAARFPLEDKATKDVPGANLNFDRVIIQRNVVGETYAGTAYFHYNR